MTLDNDNHQSLRHSLRSAVKSETGRNFAIATITCSTFLALIITTLQLFVEYQTESVQHSEALSKIESSFASGLAESLWLLDDALIMGQISGIAQIEGVSKVEIIGAGDEYAVKNDVPQSGTQLSFPIKRASPDGSIRQLGTLNVTANADHIVRRLVQRAAFVMATNFIKTICVALAMLYIFQKLVGQQVSKLVDFAETYDPRASGQRLDLGPTGLFFKRRQDYEFRALENAINRWSIDADRQIETLYNANREQAEFTYALSHDLKSPANTMQMLIEELEEDENLDAAHRSLVSDMKATNRRMSHLVEDVLLYSQLIGEDHKFEPVDLNGLLDEIVADHTADLTQVNAKVTWAELPIISGHRFQLRLLFQNLISNAIKFKRPEQVPEVNISAQNTRGSIVISVSDNGIGIPSKYRKSVFGLFKRLHSRSEFEGTGLGLAICGRVMSNHLGRISIRSNDQGGTTFDLTFQEETLG